MPVYQSGETENGDEWMTLWRVYLNGDSVLKILESGFELVVGPLVRPVVGTVVDVDMLLIQQVGLDLDMEMEN